MGVSPPPVGPDAVADETLVERAKDGDADAFAELVDRFQTPLFRLVLRIVSDRAEAEDVVQETLITAWRRLESVQDGTRIRPWLYRIATNRALDVVRARGRRPTESLDTEHAEQRWLTEPPARGPEGSTITRAQWEDLSRAVQTLPAQQRACWLLRELDGFSYAEIAQITQLSQATVRGQLARARMALVKGMQTWM